MEKERVVPIVLGGLVAAGLKGLDESIYYSNTAKWSGKFPFIGTVEPLPPVDVWLFLGGSGLVYVLGRATKHKNVENFGLGALIFSGADFLRSLVMHAIGMTGHQFATNRYGTVPIAAIKEI